MSALRDMVANLSDDALASAASLGLVRRATADAAKVVIESESESEAILKLEADTVRLVSEGLDKSTCTCPAPGVCRHRLAAVIHMRESAAAPVAVEWREVFDAITPSAIERFAGKAGFTEALARARAGASVDARTGAFVVTFKDVEHVVTFLPSGTLAAAITKAPAKLRKALVAAAALAARGSFDLAVPEAEQAGALAKATPTRPNSDALATVREFLERTYAGAFATAPVAFEDEARRLALAGRVEAIPRLAVLLRRIATGLSLARRRDATADPEDLLGVMAEAYALCEALRTTTDETRLQKLGGQVRQEYDDVGELELKGLGARLWETPGGAHGVTSYFFAPTTSASYTLTLARPDRTDATFNPITAFRMTPVWGVPPGRLCESSVRLDAAKASSSGRLSASASSRAGVTPWMPERDSVRGWSCAFSDWQQLEAHLQRIFTPSLAGEGVREVPVVLMHTRSASARFDELTQTLNWPLADAAGRWIGLSLSYEGRERTRIAALEEAIGRERFWAVLATANEDAGRIELRPYALWGAKQILLDFAPMPAKGPEGLLERLRRLATRVTDGPRTTLVEASASGAVLDRTWDALLRQAEIGGLQTADRTGLSKQLTLAGLSQLSALFEQSDSEAGHGLRAAYCVGTLRRARARLGWMT